MKGVDIYVDNIIGENVRQLFINVVLRAVKDAFYTKSTETTTLQKEQATAWLCNGSADFYEVCSLAGLNGENVRRKALYFAKLRSDKRGKYIKKMMDPCVSQETKNMLLLESLAYGQDFMFYETTQGDKKPSPILNRAFELCNKGDISIKMKCKDNKLQYIATGERL